jgi:hypothetical protein
MASGKCIKIPDYIIRIEVGQYKYMCNNCGERIKEKWFSHVCRKEKVESTRKMNMINSYWEKQGYIKTKEKNLCAEKSDDRRHSIAAAAQKNLKEKPKIPNKFTNNRFLSDEQRNDKFFQQGVEKGRKEGIKLAAEKAQNIPNESPFVKSAIKLVQVMEGNKNSHLNAKINILSDCINNAASQAKNGNGNGNRFSEDSKVFSSIIKLNSGSRMSSLFSYNLGGPAASTTKKYMKDHEYNFQCGEISMSNLEKIISIWNSIIEKKERLFDERDDILIMCQQDCTGINPAAKYDASSNKVLGAIFKGGDSNRNFEVMAELPQTFTDIQIYLESLELVSYSMLTMLVFCR